MPTMTQANQTFIAQTVADVQAASMNQGFTLSYRGPAGDFDGAFGLGNRRPAVPININDKGRIGSTHKSFIACLILREIDRGTPVPGTSPVETFSLDTKLSKFVNGVPKGNEITIHDMLTMRSGVYDYQSNRTVQMNFALNQVTNFVEPTDQLTLIRGNTTGTPVNTKFEYTNSNYILLGEVLRVLTGRNWRDLIQNDILTPCGLTNTIIPAHQDWMIPTPYMHGFSQHMLAPWVKDADYSAWNPDLFGSAGSMLSTAPDLAKWGQIMASGWELSPAMNAIRNTYFFYEPWTLGEGITTYGYGLGNFAVGEWRGHDGSVPGYSAQCMYHPPTGAVIAGLENYQSPDVAIFSRVFVRTARHLYPGSI